jgi:ketosteroid isomerase-like protein
MPLFAQAYRPPESQNYKTIEELFSAYKKATESRDWNALFLLGTPERQDCDLLMLVVSAAKSNDEMLRTLVEKHGANWKQFNHAWTEADHQRFMRGIPLVAASLGKQIREKPEMFAAAQSYVARKCDPSSTKVHKLKNLVRHGATAVGESVESRTCIERHYDAKGNQIGQTPRTFSVRSRLWFRQVDGRWHIATENEITPAGAEKGGQKRE